MILFKNNEEFARQMDRDDPLAGFRNEFRIPKDILYFAGNSLGLQPAGCEKEIRQELEDWANLGVEGHFEASRPWLSYHEVLTHEMARLCGAKPIEVVVMNTLTVNLHLMMVSFYSPTPQRNAILIEGGAFPSDRYAVASQIRYHGFDPKISLLELSPRAGETCLRTEDILKFISENGHRISLILLGSVNYLTGQAFDIEAITRAAHAQGCRIGFDLAHGAGNLELKLHDWGPDFAVWCSYKYLNGGPGSLAGCFVHERHASSRDLPRFAGWWGHNKSTRFRMGPEFDPIPGAEGWQLSNPPIFQMAALKASLELFDRATISKLRAKSVLLTSYLEFLLDEFPHGLLTQITPRNPAERGCQLSIRIHNSKELVKKLSERGVICDFREPDILRIAPVPLYNRFLDIYQFSKILRKAVEN